MTLRPRRVYRHGVHTHVGVIALASTFVGVLLFGTLWRVSAAHLMATSSPTANRVGQAMGVQY